MSEGRNLREQFQKERQTEDIATKAILGIVAEEMKEVIIADMSAMITKGYRKHLDGYVFCLSRIIKHSTAWECITIVFNKSNEPIPLKYYTQFGQKSSH